MFVDSHVDLPAYCRIESAMISFHIAVFSLLLSRKGRWRAESYEGGKRCLHDDSRPSLGHGTFSRQEIYVVCGMYFTHRPSVRLCKRTNLVRI